MSQLKQISKYISQNTRNRIVFSDSSIDGLDFVDVGFCMATELARNHDANPVDLANKILSVTKANAEIGNYLAIDNIGILFEPELKLDIRGLLDSYSKNQTLIIRSDATVADSKFYFLSPEDKVSVDLDGLSFITINKRDNI